jgi:antitoxin ParD1/3/4
MAKNTSVALGDHSERIIEKSIETGIYSSASEVIREGLRLVDVREQKIKILREAIEARVYNPVKLTTQSGLN